MLDMIQRMTVMYFEPKLHFYIETRRRKGPRKGRKRLQLIKRNYSAFLEANPFEKVK
ncbi:hypothetical protein IS230_003904 [Salmonella enterica]|nr:hypothetical protein [Salmonella enterica]